MSNHFPSATGRLIAAVAACCIMAGCSQSPSPPPDPHDYSLTIAEYEKLGVPSLGKPWTAADYSKANTVLVSLAQTNPTLLPRYQSPRSGALFARITAAQNLDPLRNTSSSYDQRISDSLTILTSGNDFLTIYLAAHGQMAVGGSELIELMGFLCRTCVVVFDLTEQILASLSPEEAADPTRQQGFNNMKGGISQVVNGALITLTERQTYRTTDRLRLIGYLEETLHRLVPRLTTPSRDHALAMLASMDSDAKLKDLQPALHALREKTEKAAASPGSP